jgi:hypothetical protein
VGEDDGKTGQGEGTIEFGITRIARSRCLAGPSRSLRPVGPAWSSLFIHLLVAFGSLFGHDEDARPDGRCKDYPIDAALDYWQPCSWRGRVRPSAGPCLPSPASIRCLTSVLQPKRRKLIAVFSCNGVRHPVHALWPNTFHGPSQYTTGSSEVPNLDPIVSAASIAHGRELPMAPNSPLDGATYPIRTSGRTNHAVDPTVLRRSPDGARVTRENDQHSHLRHTTLKYLDITF